MGEDHGPDEAEAGGEAGGEQSGDGSEEIGPEEDRAEGGGIDAETQIEPVGGKALDDEAAAEGVEGVEGGEFEDDARE